MKKSVLSVFGLLVALALLISSTGFAQAAASPVVNIQILNVSDWHGQLEPLAGGIGGAAALKTYFDNEKAANPNTIILTAGDAVGATPPVSAFFDDAPTIEAMNMMGFQLDTFGNHNFDHGIAQLQGQIDMANFQYISANLLNRNQNLTGVKDWVMMDVDNVKVAIIGITNPEAPTLVFPGNFGTMTPTDPVAAAIRARNQAKLAGAQVVIVITHMGVTGFNGSTPYGPLVDFAQAVGAQNTWSRKVDVIIGDHTDIQFSGIINGILVHENKSKGFTYARTNITYDRNLRRVTNRTVTFVSPIVANVTPDAGVAALIAGYNAQIAPIMQVVIATSNVSIPRSDRCGQSAGRTCESLIGNVTTDAMRNTYGVDFALTNSGGLRDSMTCLSGYAPGFCPTYTPPPFQITRGEMQAVLPFGNVVVTLSVNGAELKTMLENAVSSMPGVNGRFGQVSGLCFTYNIEAAVGSRVMSAVRQDNTGACTGPAVGLTAASTYTIAENDFMVNGGDGYPNFAPRSVTREVMVDVVSDYISATSPLNPVYQNRITCYDPNPGSGNNCPVILY